MNLSKIQGGVSIELDWKRNVQWKNIGLASITLDSQVILHTARQVCQK